jgi:hypothetical protein
VFRKYVFVLLILTGLLALAPYPARANHVDSASASVLCNSYSITVSASELTDTGVTFAISYTLTLTPTSGSPITITDSIPVTSDSNGTFTGTVTKPIGPLTGEFTVSGTASLLEDKVVQNTVDIGFSTSTFSCGTPPTGKTFSIGPSSMEGNLFIHAGDWVNGGYSFSFVSNGHPSTNYTVTATVTVPVTCPQGGGAGGNIVVSLGTNTYGVPAGNTNWLPTGDANSILSWQGATQAPDLCNGNVMNNQHGAIFATTVSQDPPAGLVNWRFKYRDPAAKGKPNTNCTDASDPNRNRADVCGASWSQTVRDP